MPRNLRQTQSSQTDNASRVRTGILSAILLFVLVAALFSPSVRYPLSDLDDADYIAQNRLVTRGFAPGALRGAFDVSDTTASMYMPLLWLSYMADVTFFHASVRNPAPFHAVNVFLHALSAVFLFTLLRRLRAPPLWAFLLALLWAAHPLRVESVAWIAERKDVLSAALGLASTLAWLESARSGRGTFPRIVLLTFSLLLYAAGLLAKPSLVPLPLAWLALDVWPLSRIPASPRSPDFLPAILRAAAAKLPFLPFALVAAWLAVARHHAVSGALAVPWPTRLAAVAPNFFFYVRKTILPLRLSPLVPEQWHFSLPVILLSLLAAGTLVAVLWRFRRSLPSLLPGVVWLLLFFFPASGLQPLPMNTVADRFFYLPAMGISIALAGLPSVLLPQVRRVLYAATAFLLLPLAVLSIRLLPVWSSSQALYEHVLRAFPGHPLASATLAEQIIRDTGDFRRADALAREALARLPYAHHPAVVHVVCLANSDSPRAALDWLGSFPEPDSLRTRANFLFLRARLELALGNSAAALESLRTALPLCPGNSTLRSPMLLCGLAAALDASDRDTALRFARQTLVFPSVSSVSIEHAMPFAIYQWVSGFRQDALHWFWRILDECPDRLDLWNNVVWGLATASWSPADPAEVLSKARHAQSLAPDPDHPGILDTVAAACANAGDFDTAVQIACRALDALPAGAPLAERIAGRLELYRQHRPYREHGFDRIFHVVFGPPESVL